jgi:hypothetical protein
MIKLKDILTEGKSPIKTYQDRANLMYEKGEDNLVKQLTKSLLQSVSKLKGTTVVLKSAISDDSGAMERNLSIEVVDVKVYSFTEGGYERTWKVYLTDKSGETWYED